MDLEKEKEVVRQGLENLPSSKCISCIDFIPAHKKLWWIYKSGETTGPFCAACCQVQLAIAGVKRRLLQ